MESHYGVCSHNAHSNIRSLSELRSLGKTLTELVFDAGCESYTKLEELDFSEYKNVTRIVIGNHSFKRVKEVIVEGLPLLVELVFGEGCFSYAKEADEERDIENLLSGRRARLRSYRSYADSDYSDNDWDEDSEDSERYEESDEYPYDSPYEDRPNGTLRVAACSALKRVTIGGCCCTNYTGFSLEKLPALETLTIGSRESAHFCGSFFHAELHLEGSGVRAL